MTRLAPIDPASAPADARALLDAVRASLGVAPNFVRVLAHSPKALEGFLGLYGAAGGFAFDKATQERIALAVAEGNACDYCLAAHTAIGRASGLGNDEMLRNRAGSSADPAAGAAVTLARSINDQVGGVTDADIAAARAAGLSDRQIVEVIALVALNVFTNLVGKVSRVDIDFPRVAALGTADRRAA